ncbi:hypothetical protein GCM10022247_52470 [Allokutzneria multivorans]|uniref:Uncharacterized protein n=1 Tax=Allokutzneria multivorans TaxID=1142134 RepID=A0ABP7T891_9PSEU
MVLIRGKLCVAVLAILTVLSGASSGLASAQQQRTRAAEQNELSDGAATVLVFRLRADCVRNATFSFCELVKDKDPKGKLTDKSDADAKKSVKGVFDNGKQLASSIANSDLKDAAKGLKIDKTSAATVKKTVTDHVLKKVEKHDSFAKTKPGKAYLKNAAPSKGGAALWAANTAFTLMDSKSTTTDKVVAAVGIIPVIGAAASFLQTVNKEDATFEDIMVGSIALVASIVVIANPLIGAGINAVLAAYALGKALFEWMSSPTDSRKPLTVEDFRKHEIAKIGAQWEAGGTKAVLQAKGKTGEQILTIMLRPTDNVVGLRTKDVVPKQGDPVGSNDTTIAPLALTTPEGFTATAVRYYLSGSLKATAKCANAKPDAIPYWECRTDKEQHLTVTANTPLVVDVVVNATKADLCTTEKQCENAKLRIDLSAYAPAKNGEPYSMVLIPYKII